MVEAFRFPKLGSGSLPFLTGLLVFVFVLSKSNKSSSSCGSSLMTALGGGGGCFRWTGWTDFGDDGGEVRVGGFRVEAEYLYVNVNIISYDNGY